MRKWGYPVGTWIVLSGVPKRDQDRSPHRHMVTRARGRIRGSRKGVGSEKLPRQQPENLQHLGQCFSHQWLWPVSGSWNQFSRFSPTWANNNNSNNNNKDRVKYKMSECIACRKDKFMSLFLVTYVVCVCMCVWKCVKSSWKIYFLLWTMVKKSLEPTDLSHDCLTPGDLSLVSLRKDYPLSRCFWTQSYRSSLKSLEKKVLWVWSISHHQ